MRIRIWHFWSMRLQVFMTKNLQLKKKLRVDLVPNYLSVILNYGCTDPDTKEIFTDPQHCMTLKIKSGYA
jgi:uncharacterized protein YutD